MVKCVVGSALVAVALASAGFASADAVDDRYLQLLGSHGIVGDPGVLIGEGHASCDALDQGRIGFGISPYQIAVVGIMGRLSGQGLGSQQVPQLMADAQSVYCPGKA